MPVDHLFRGINVGDRVAYPMRRGSRMWLTTMKVEKIEELGESFLLLGVDATGRRTRTKNLQNCVVIDER